jgi:carbohydrate kinase (thermoresistant glucokinase family)
MDPIVVVVMGVSGSGKSTVAELLARRLGWHFAEADKFHSPANVEKMRSGIALTDEDRGPWLAAMAEYIDVARASETPTVITCSALKRRYRDVIVGSRPDVALVYLEGDYETIARRMSERADHYMPVSLLKSQFDALEAPGAGEHPIVAHVSRSPQEIVEGVLAALRDPAPPARG